MSATVAMRLWTCSTNSPGAVEAEPSRSRHLASALQLGLADWQVVALTPLPKLQMVFEIPQEFVRAG